MRGDSETTATQTVAQAVNKHTVVSFIVTTTDALTKDVITQAQLGAAGVTTIREIHLRCTGDKCFLGLGTDATTTHGANIVPVWADTFFNFEDCMYTKLEVIRSAATNVTIEGWVVAN